jgi:hypothetical protein
MSPVERPVEHLRVRQIRRTGRASSRIRAPKDQRPLPFFLDSPTDPQPPIQRRISSRTLNDIQALMSESDRGLLLFVQSVRLATGAQLRTVMDQSADDESAARTTRRTLQRLCEWRVLDRLPTRAAGGRRGGSDSYTYFVGPAGLRLLDRLGFQGRRLGAPSDRHVRHTLGIAELVVRLIAADKAGELELLAWESEPSCWRAFIGYGGQRVILKPDLAVRIGVGNLEELRYLVEFDQATESPSTLAGKLKRHIAYRASGTELAAHGIDPKVLWLVPDVQRAEVLRQLIRRLPESERPLFDVTTHADAVPLLAREARS